MPSKLKKVSVSFPCVHGTGKGEVITITCFPVNEMKGTIKIPAVDIEDVARRVIGASRHDETDHRAANGVIAMFSNPQFTGLSYTLALAIADKLTTTLADFSQQIVDLGFVVDGPGR